jgi:hypothetical protein
MSHQDQTMSYSAMAWHPHNCSHLLRPGPYKFFERYLLLINVCFSRAIALIYCSKQTMVPPATTSSKKRRRKKQSEVFLEPTPNRRRSEESPPAVTQTQPFPSSNGHSTPSPNHPQTLIGSPPINGEPPVPTTNPATPTNLDSAIVLPTIATTGPSIRTNVSSGEHIAFGSQATPTKRTKLDAIFSPLKKLFIHENDPSIDPADTSYQATTASSADSDRLSDEATDDIVSSDDE